MTTATWYHASLKPVSRSAGRSVVAAAAYRTGEKYEDREYSETRDYSRRGGVVASFTLAPEDAPQWALNPEQLWNEAAAKENRKNSQLAHEWEGALPNELGDSQREVIARAFSQYLVDQYGVAVTTGIHNGGERGNGKNDHMHVLMTTRAIGEDGWAKNKLRDFSVKPGTPNPAVDKVRGVLADLINSELAKAGSPQQVTHLSYEARGIDREPTQHLGPNASEMERREPGSSDRGEFNRDIEESNRSFDALVAELASLDAEITEAQERELDARFGPAEPEAMPHQVEAVLPEPATATPREAVAVSFETAIRAPVTALETPNEIEAAPAILVEPETEPAATETPRQAVANAFNAATRPAVAMLATSGETSTGARLWEKAVDLLQRGAGWLAEIGREAVGTWQRLMGHEPDRLPDYDPGPSHASPQRGDDGPER